MNSLFKIMMVVSLASSAMAAPVQPKEKRAQITFAGAPVTIVVNESAGYFKVGGLPFSAPVSTSPTSVVPSMSGSQDVSIFERKETLSVKIEFEGEVSEEEVEFPELKCPDVRITIVRTRAGQEPIKHTECANLK